MKDDTTPIEELFEKAENYSLTTVELLKLKAIDKSAEVVSSLVVKLAILLAVALFFIVLNIGIALWIGELMGKSYYGFFMISLGYAILTIFLYAFRDNYIRYPVSNSIITQLMKNKVHEKE